MSGNGAPAPVNVYIIEKGLDRELVMYWYQSHGRIIASGPIDTMLASEHPWLKSYFRGKRGRPVRH